MSWRFEGLNSSCYLLVQGNGKKRRKRKEEEEERRRRRKRKELKEVERKERRGKKRKLRGREETEIREELQGKEKGKKEKKTERREVESGTLVLCVVIRKEAGAGAECGWSKRRHRVRQREEKVGASLTCSLPTTTKDTPRPAAAPTASLRYLYRVASHHRPHSLREQK